AALAGVGVVTLAGAALGAFGVRDRPPGVAAPPAGRLRDVLAGTGQVLRNPHTWPPFLAFFCFYSVVGNQMLWTVPYLRDVYGLGLGAAAFYATATSLALLIAAPLIGFASDRVLGRREAPRVSLGIARA